MLNPVRSVLQRLAGLPPADTYPGHNDLCSTLVQIGVVPSTTVSATWLPPTHERTLNQHPWTGGMWIVRTTSESFAVRYQEESPFLGTYLPWERYD